MQNWQFWVALLVPLAVAVFFAIRHSLHIRSIEEEISDDLGLDARWLPPDDKGKGACHEVREHSIKPPFRGDFYGDMQKEYEVLQKIRERGMKIVVPWDHPTDVDIGRAV